MKYKGAEGAFVSNFLSPSSDFVSIDRRRFIKQVCAVCAGGAAIGALLSACSAASMTTGEIEGSDMVVPLAAFRDGSGFKRFLVVRNDTLQYPIYVYRLNEREYKASWMQCTHQGTRLQAFGERLECPAHGSVFAADGAVVNGPAKTNLRTFPVTVEGDRLRIGLKR